MRRAGSGFTLVEVVIALAILAMAFFGMISVVTYTARMNASTRERTLAMRAAERKIEQMLSYQDWNLLFTEFSDNTAAGEGKGWEQVKELASDGTTNPALQFFPPTAAVPKLTMATGFTYPAPLAPSAVGMNGRQMVLFVRFPLNAAGTGMSELGAGTFAGLATADLDLDGKAGATSGSVAIIDCKILPISIEVYWKPSVGDRATPGYLNYKYIFLKKT